MIDRGKNTHTHTHTHTHAQTHAHRRKKKEKKMDTCENKQTKKQIIKKYRFVEVKRKKEKKIEKKKKKDVEDFVTGIERSWIFWKEKRKN